MPVTPLDYDSGDLPLDADVREGRASFQTPDVPQPMEAFLTISRIRNFGSGRLRILLHDRQALSRPGEFAGGDSCRFRFRLRFAPGVNYARLEFLGGAPDLSSATFRIGDAVHSERTWTHPFVRMDIAHPRWIGIVRDEVVDLVRSYHVDAVHCDAGNIATRPSESSRCFLKQSRRVSGQDMREKTSTEVFGARRWTLRTTCAQAGNCGSPCWPAPQ